MKPSYRIAELEKIVDAFRQRAFEAERERDELRHSDYLMWHAMACKNGERAQKAEAEIARRDAAAGEPVAWQYRYNDGKVGDWKTVDSESECNHSPCYERRAIYTVAPPALLPPEKPVNTDLSRTDIMKNIAYNQALDDVKALGAQPQKPAPDGWKLVPVEPTQRMIDAHTEGMASGGATRAYRALIAASPTPGGDGE